jgi:hypothetical protein
MSCEICGEDKKRILLFQRKRPVCWIHYNQLRRHGKPLERTKYTPNEFVVHEDRAEIVLYEGESKPVARAIIDLADIEEARKYKWHRAIRKGGRPYVEAFSRGKAIFLHHLVAGKRQGFDLDHINGDTLDTRRANLRHLSHHANVLNRTRGLAKSGRLGVYWRTDRNGWYAQIRMNGRATVRAFHSKEDAIAWREEMERKHIGISVSDLAV